MTRYETINALKQLREAYNAYRKELNDQWSLASYEEHMEIVPIRPEKPIKPTVPSNSQDISLEEIKILSYEEYYYEKIDSYVMPAHFSFENWQKVLTAIFVIISIGSLIIALGTKKEMVIIASVVCAIIAFLIFLVSVLRFISDKLRYKNIAENVITNEYDKYCKECEKHNNEYLEKKNKAIRDFKEYEYQNAKYEVEASSYDKRVEEYERAYDTEKSNALKKIEEHNKIISENALKAYDEKKKSLSIEFPDKYCDSLDEIITILEDMRADTIKEAINVLIDDNHKAKMLQEQSKLVAAQEEMERRQRQAEFDEQDRIDRLRARCSLCRHYKSCPMRSTITESCSGFEYN